MFPNDVLNVGIKVKVTFYYQVAYSNIPKEVGRTVTVH